MPPVYRMPSEISFVAERPNLRLAALRLRLFHLDFALSILRLAALPASLAEDVKASAMRGDSKRSPIISTYTTGVPAAHIAGVKPVPRSAPLPELAVLGGVSIAAIAFAFLDGVSGARRPCHCCD